ncbi:hypothetical protein F511_18949 [Dorcoceras hygrometricum]|uniref:Polyadenylate-binding protein 1-B-binding protein n=1 Tax=Dorcoceras hygrometricum TaxID=472368 RepID=A0A2Z7D493_9LAMI|nr:hypothetical protein F511_18949 [Dorcoceras hygrometricum]
MDREQEEIQFLGFFGIVRESYSLVSSWRKIFSQIMLALILPLSSVYLAQIQITQILIFKIVTNESTLERTPEGSRSYDRISNLISSEWTEVLLFKIGYLLFFLILALLSTSAVVYTIACIYTAKEITFVKVMSVVPKVWKRLIVTFICYFVIVFAYNIIAVIIPVLAILLFQPSSTVGVILLLFYLIIYFIGFLYINMIWQLASVVSVLEESYGVNAMLKSQSLIKGKMGVCVAIFFVLGLLFIGVEIVFKVFVVTAYEKGLGYRVGLGIGCLSIMSIVILLVLVMQTIVYFVCKSYHHENIDKSALADHLGEYLGEYVPLKSKDVQMEQFEEV